MYIVVIGLGEVGKHLLSVMQHEGHDVVAIDRRSAAVTYAGEHFDVATLEGYGASEDILAQAGVSQADLVVAVSDHDEVNLIAALAAKQLGAKRVVARAQGNEWAKWREGIRYGLLGVDVVINPRVLVGQELGRVARSHGAVDVIDLAQDRIELVQMEMTSRMANKPLAKLSLPRETLVAAYVRDDELVVPGGADVLLPGDTVYLIGRPNAILQAEDLFSTRREAKRILIVGGGVIGQALARQVLPHGAFVTILERDEEVAEELASKHDGLDVRLGDGTDAELLQEIEVESYDLCACVTQEDEVNLMAALIAKRAGVQRTAAVVQRADYGPIYRQLGIDIVLSPRTVASDHILRFCRGAAVHSVHVLEGGAAEVIEVTAQRGSSIVGKPLRRIQVPKGTLVCAIIRPDDVVIVGLHFAVDANWGAQFNLAPEGGHEIASESQGIRVLMDLATAQRARGATIDWVSSLHGEGLAIDLPLAPPPVQALSVSDLKSRLDSGDITLIDVRSEDERGMASIEQAIALDVDQVEAMPRDSELAFLCHHGNSSMGAAEYFRKKGFTRVYNVTGGINAWALEVDSSVPTY